MIVLWCVLVAAGCAGLWLCNENDKAAAAERAEFKRRIDEEFLD